MTGSVKIGIIGAAGWLGSALAKAVVKAGLADSRDLTLSYRSGKPEFLPEATWTTDNSALIEHSDIVIVSVRPEDFDAIGSTSRGKLVISVMAGITIEQLAQRFHTERVVRSLPNAGLEVGASYTPWVGTKALGPEDCRIVQAIFDACGTSDRLAAEGDIDYFTGLTGSGPAFLALLASAMMQDAVRRGTAPDVALRGVNALLVGTGRLIEQRRESPAALVQTFMDYKGTTAAAMNAMLSAGLNEAVCDGLEAAFQKSISMGRSKSFDGLPHRQTR